MIKSNLFDFSDKMFYLTSTMDLCTEEGMFKMTDHLLYLSKNFRQVGSDQDNFDKYQYQYWSKLNLVNTSCLQSVHAIRFWYYHIGDAEELAILILVLFYT